MFEVGFAELFVLGVVALLVVGPERLPGLARTLGVWVGKAQRLVGQVRADIEREVRADELRKAAKEYSPTGVISDIKKEVKEFTSEISRPLDLDAEETRSGGSDAADAGPAATGTAESQAAKPAQPQVAEPPSEGAAELQSAKLSSADSPGGPAAAEPEAAVPPAEDSAELEPAEPLVADAAEPEAAVPPAEDAAEPEPAEPLVTDAADPDPESPEPANGARAESEPADDAEPSNGRTVDAPPPVMTESVEAPPIERDERTAAS